MKITALIVFAITCSLLAAACGNGPQAAPPLTPTKATAASTPTPAASVPALVTKAPTGQPASLTPTPISGLCRFGKLEGISSR